MQTRKHLPVEVQLFDISQRKGQIIYFLYVMTDANNPQFNNFLFAHKHGIRFDGKSQRVAEGTVQKAFCRLYHLNHVTLDVLNNNYFSVNTTHNEFQIMAFNYKGRATSQGNAS